MNWGKTKIEYDASNNPIYIGKSKEPDKNEDHGGWYIKKITYDASSNPIDIEKKIGVWADRANLGWG